MDHPFKVVCGGIEASAEVFFHNKNFIRRTAFSVSPVRKERMTNSDDRENGGRMSNF
jgi:hypothetical protein